MSAASPVREATIVLDPEGRYVDASPLALELLGVDLPTLRTKRPDDFRDPATGPVDEARRRELLHALPGGLLGETRIRRADGSTFRARFTLTSDPERPGYVLATIEPLSSPGADRKVQTLAEILQEWRQAERELATLKSGTPEWRAVEARVDQARDAYQRLSQILRDRPRP